MTFVRGNKNIFTIMLLAFISVIVMFSAILSQKRLKFRFYEKKYFSITK